MDAKNRKQLKQMYRFVYNILHYMSSYIHNQMIKKNQLERNFDVE